MRRLLPWILAITYLRCMKQICSTVTTAKAVKPLAESKWLVWVVDGACRIITSGAIQLAHKRSGALVFVYAFSAF